MTTEQKTTVSELFTRFGNPCDTIEPKIYGFFSSPDSILNPSDMPRHDKRAEQMIAECQRMILKMEAYRIALAERYNALLTAPSIPVVRLERYNGYSGIVYYLRVFRRYAETGEQYETECQTFTGKDRSKAIKAYREYVKAHPGITAELDIEKRPWER